jgi:predicted restriction endonuclease
VKIEPRELADLMIEIANERFGSQSFRRRQLMNATEQELRLRGLWTPEDDPLSSSVGTKSHGLANIDFRFFDLARKGAIVSDRRDVWRLAELKPPTTKEFLQLPVDLAEPPSRSETRISRIIRDTQAARALKKLYEFHCQVCAMRIEPSLGSFYIEVHHVRPLGGEHKGLDSSNNMLVLCPNHHAMFDFGIPRFLSTDLIEIAGVSHPLNLKHELDKGVIAYHNDSIHHNR